MERRTFLASAAAAATAMALDPAKADTLPLGNLPNWRYPDPRVEVLDDKKFKYMVGNAAIERIATGFRWAEGPVYFRDGGFLVWSDIPNNRMMRWLEEDGHVSVFRTPSNYTNGNTRDREGRLISCEHDARRVTRTEPDGTIDVLLDSYEGKKLNAPNDVVVASDGAIWFTDPGYGILGNYEGHKADFELPPRVYRIDGKTGRATIVAGTDIDGNVWCSMGWADPKEDGVRCYAPTGELIGKIHLPETCSNLCFGGKKRNRLFMTGSTSVYAVYVETQGALKP